MQREVIVGIALAIGVVCFARWTRLDRDRVFYPIMLIVVASYYVLFAAMTGSAHAVIVESIVAAAFVLVAVVGFRRYPWLVIAGLAGHGVFDLFHAPLVHSPGVPEWWPGFCLAFDVGAAILLALFAEPSAEGWMHGDGAGNPSAEVANKGCISCPLLNTPQRTWHSRRRADVVVRLPRCGRRRARARS